jgi:serine/threonine-protein phosphatase 2A regulatory subunit B
MQSTNNQTTSSTTPTPKETEKKTNEELKIMEWRYSQFLGEKLSYEQIKSDTENESFLVTNVKFSNDGTYVVVSDKGGRVILFKKSDVKNKQPKLDYFYEFAAQEKEFDVHKSIEYNEEVRAMTVLSSTDNNKVDIMTAGYRTIKIDRIFKDKIKVYENSFTGEKSLNVPKVSNFKTELKHKTKKLLRSSHNYEINSISENKINRQNFISSDDFKIFMWDLNVEKEVYNVVDIDLGMEVDNPEKITKSIVCDYNPHLFAYGTNKGNIRICDMRTSSDMMTFSTNFYDENSNLNKTIFANALLGVHDICMSFSNSYSFASRHYLSVNLWDLRKQNEPNTKFLVYEPVINKLSYLYQNNYLNDKFSLSTDSEGKYLITGGYNNMFHVLDIEQRLNTQIVIDDSNEKLMNTNVIRKINSKGSCFYKKDDPSLNNINFDKKILHQAFSPVENFALLIVYNCIYSYCGSVTKKEAVSSSTQGTNGAPPKKK